MKPWFTGILIGSLIVLFTVIGIIPMMIIALLRLLIPVTGVRNACSDAVTWIAEMWAAANKALFNRLTRTQWDVRGQFELEREQSYLLICNHQSWVDIPAIIQVFNRKVPFFRFFVKQQLAWVPLLGLAFWALEFPFMRRYSKEVLAKKPHLRGKDLAATKAACERFRHRPVTMINFPEGTRFTPAKHSNQDSPYRHLLRPKAGGMAYVLESMGDQIDHILNVTIAYPDGTPTFIHLISGQVGRVVIAVEAIPVREEWRVGGYLDNQAYRETFQAWVSHLWQEKDEQLARLGN